MDFELTDDQLALRDAASSLLAAKASPDRVRRVVDAGGGADAELWSAMVEQGWAGVDVPEAHGGLGLSFVEATVLLEQVGAYVAPSPFLQQIVALWALTRSGAGADWIERLVSGDAIATIAWREVESAGDAVSGRTEPALYAPSADVAVVRTSDGLFAVDLAAHGRPQRESAMDRTREVGWLAFDDTPAIRLGDAAAAAGFLERGAVAHAAEMLGGAQRALDMAVNYAKERQQFGRPIGSFQAVKHRCADMLVDVEGMRSAVYWAAWCLAAGDPDAAVAASTAKVWCTDAAKRVMASALQVHGGIGFTWEHDVHLYLKRSQLDQVSFGDATFHRSRLADLLRARLEAGESVV